MDNKIDMLDILHRAEFEMPNLLLDESKWNSVLVDYHPPVVERLWLSWYERRIYLHILHPCLKSEALFHTHPWASAVKILEGMYVMCVGYGEGKEEPQIATRIIMNPGSKYEMSNPFCWHSVQPIMNPCISIMVTDIPWKTETAPKSTKSLQPLSKERRSYIFEKFGEFYPQQSN